MKAPYLIQRRLFHAALQAALLLALALGFAATPASHTIVRAQDAPLDIPEVIVDEPVNAYLVTDGFIYWAYRCDGGEFRVPGYLRRMPSHGGARTTLETTSADTCWTFWHLAADSTGVYYVNYETDTLDFRPTDDPTHAVSLYTFTTLNSDPVAPLELDGDYIYWASYNDRIYRLPKTGGTATILDYTGTGLIDIEQWGDQLYWLEDSGLWHCTKPDCPSVSRASTHTGNYLRSWFFTLFWVEQGTPQSIRQRTCFLGCSETTIYTAPADWIVNRPAVGGCPTEGQYCLYWEEYSTVVINGRLRRFPISGGTADIIADNLLRGVNPAETDDLGVYFLLSNTDNYGIGRLPFTASIVQRDMRAYAWEVTQGVQSLDNDVPLVANKTTYVRLYPTITGDHANYVQAWLEGERGGTPLPGSPLEPLNGDFSLDETWMFNRNDVNTSYLFQLPDGWTDPGTLTLRAVVDPREIYADTDPGDNTLTGTFTFIEKPPVCDIFIPVRTHTPAASVEAPNFWRMIDLHRRLWPVPDVWVYRQNNDVAEPQVCWAWIFPYPCSGPFELNEGTSWDDWYKDDEEALMHISARAAFSDDPDECDDLGSAIHYIGMVHPDAPWGWGGLAYVNDWQQPASLVVMPSYEADPPTDWTWPWEGSSLAHETSHNHERRHVDCGDPANPASYPYPTCQIDDTGEPYEFGYDFGFDVNERQPISMTIASDYMSYSPDSTEAPLWQGRWVSDFTYNAMFGRFSLLSDLEMQGPPSIAAAPANVLISAIVEPVSGEASLHPAWVFPSTALSQGLLEKWQALAAPVYNTGAASQGEAADYHVRLLDADGASLADFALSPQEMEVHQTETRGLVFQQTFAAPAGDVARLDLMSDGAVLASLEPGSASPVLSIQLPAGGEVFTDSMTITWQASDPDPGDHLTFNLQYSPDNGLTWKSIAEYLPAAIEGDVNTLVLDDLGGLGASDGANGLIRVAATDGYHTVIIDSNPFTVEDQPPQVYVLSPDSLTTYPPTESVALRGGAMDPETGAVDDDHLTWSINGAAYAVGAETSAAGLAPGNYTLSLQAEDPAGKTAGKLALLNIERLEIPQVSPAPTMDGLCDDAQYSGVSLSLESYGSAGHPSVRLLRTSDSLWACFGGMSRSSAPSVGYAGLRVDVNNSQDAFAQSDDYGFFVRENGTPFTRSGDGAGGFDGEGPGGLLAQVSSDGENWNAELKIDASVLGGWDHPIGLELEQYLRLIWWQRSNWPYAGVYNEPDTWGWTVLGELPVINTLTPEGATAGDATFTLTLDGEGFQDGAAAYWNVTALPTTYISPTQLTAQVDTSLVSIAKYALLTVRNPNTLSSNAVLFTVQNPLPQISALNPPGAMAGSAGIELTVRGSGFVDGSEVIWNGEPLATTYVDTGTLRAVVDVSLLAYATPVSVVVRNPEPTAGQSAPEPFNIYVRGRVVLPMIAK